MNVVVEKVLNQPKFQNLDRVIHQPQKMLIRNPEKLNDAECQYAMNILTHTDFLIFNKLDQKYGIPILRIKTNESGEETIHFLDVEKQYIKRW